MYTSMKRIVQSRAVTAVLLSGTIGLVTLHRTGVNSNDFKIFKFPQLLNIFSGLSVSYCHEDGCKCTKSEATHIITSTQNVKKGSVVELTTDSFDEKVLKNDEDVFVVFYAPWCGYCKRLMPLWKDLAEATKEHDSRSIAQIDMTQHTAHVPGVTVRGYPTIYLFKKGHKGKPIEYRGGRDVASFEAFLEYYAKK